MRRANNLLHLIADPDNLRLAFWKARKGKSYSEEVRIYLNNLHQNLSALRVQILDNHVDVGKYHYFKVYDPKERQICAAAFSEQVLHHAIMNVCHPFFERAQIFDSYACRKGKGTYAALDRARLYTRRYQYFLKLDVRKFFDSISHRVLLHQLHRLLKDHAVLHLLYAIIDSYAYALEGEPRGVPIGNLTSQYFANHYLSGLDHYVKEALQAKAYVRYMDDMIIWHDDKEFLKEARVAINQFVVSRLNCTLKPVLLNYTSCGLPFLGYLILPFHTRLAQRSKYRFIRKWKYLEQQYDDGLWSETECQRHALPLFAFTQHADTKEFRKKVLNI